MCFIPIGIVILYSFRQMCNTYNKITDHLWKDILFEKIYSILSCFMLKKKILGAMATWKLVIEIQLYWVYIWLYSI